MLATHSPIGKLPRTTSRAFGMPDGSTVLMRVYFGLMVAGILYGVWNSAPRQGRRQYARELRLARSRNRRPVMQAAAESLLGRFGL